MDFYEVLEQVLVLLQRHGRVSYRALKRQFDLDDDALDDLKEELLYAHPVVDDEGRGLVWTGDAAQEPASTISLPEQPTADQERDPASYTPQHLADKILTSRSALEGENKQVTVLFCDLAASTALADRIGPEAMHALLNQFFELALDEVHRYEGTINQFLGDGFMALFGAPIAHEDHARRGVLAALALQRSLQAHHAELGEAHDATCQFRMGLNSGPVVVGSIGDNLRMDYSAVGDTTNLASRLQQLAEPGTILVSESAGRLAHGYIRLQVLPPVEVKGKTEPVTPYRVIGAQPQRSPMVSRGERTLSPFVGRARELAVLDERFEQVQAGQGQVVGLVAEAGSGKSRLLYEFRQRLEAQDQRVTYLEGRCLSYGSRIPYHPVIDMVRDNCRITEADTPEAMVNKVHAALQEIGLDVDASAPYLLQLLGVKAAAIAGLTPEAIRTRTFDTLKQMSLQGSQQRPLVFEVEDLHWIDTTSEQFLASLVEMLTGASILLLTTYRPGYRPSWLDRSYATQISLNTLTPQDAQTVVRSASQDRQLSEDVQQTVIAKAEGNPFFLEELTRAVIEHEELQADVSVPDTVQDVLSARIDRLPENHKRLLQTASVLGREFSPTVLSAMLDETDPLEGMLAELTRLEFLYQRPAADESLYVFKHALTQEVAYESLLTTSRQALHATAAQVLEQLYASRLDDAYDRLAYHYARTNNAIKAVTYLTAVADKAARAYAHSEAVASYQEAIRHAERLPEDDRDRRGLDLVIRQGASLHCLGRRQEILDLFLPQHERLERLQDPVLASRYHTWLGGTYSFLGNRRQAARCGRQALDEATQGGNDTTLGMACAIMSMEMMFTGRYPQAIGYSGRAIPLLESTEEHFWLSTACQVSIYGHYFAGDFVRASESNVRVETIAETLGDRYLQGNTAVCQGMRLAAQGEWNAGIEACQRAVDISADTYERVLNLGYLGQAYLEKIDLAMAIPVLEEAVQSAEQYRSLQVQSWFNSYLAEAYCRDQQLDNAYELASKTFEMTRTIKHWWGVGLSRRVLGRIALARVNLSEADLYLWEALQTFAAIQSRFEWGRTHVDLASLASARGNTQATSTHLCQAHALFTALQVPKYVEQTEQLAREYGITLTDIVLEELTEGDA